MISDRPICLTIAGLDPSGGAGIVADVKAFSAFQCHASAVLTSITFQNDAGLSGAVHQTGETVLRQIEAVLDGRAIGAVKTGMLPTRDIVEVAASLAGDGLLPNLVVDPVVRATSGGELATVGAIEAMEQLLFPLALLVTPNIPEAELITGAPIRSADDVYKAAMVMRSRGIQNVLIKGGHATWEEDAVDHLFLEDGVHVYRRKMSGSGMRGSGCTFASAIAANLALGLDLRGAVGAAKNYITNVIAGKTGVPDT